MIPSIEKTSSTFYFNEIELCLEKNKFFLLFEFYLPNTDASNSLTERPLKQETCLERIASYL